MTRTSDFESALSELLSVLNNPPDKEEEEGCTCDDCLEAQVQKHIREGARKIADAVEIMRRSTVHAPKKANFKVSLRELRDLLLSPQSPLDKVLADTSMDAHPLRDDNLLPSNFRLLGREPNDLDLIASGDLWLNSGRWQKVPDAYIGEDASKYSFEVRRAV